MISNILSLPKMLSGANAFEIRDIERTSGRISLAFGTQQCYLP